MKSHFLAAGLLASLTVHAQKAKDYKQFAPIFFTLANGQGRVAVYGNLADTVRKSAITLARNSYVELVGQATPHWAVYSRNGSYYFIRRADLAGLAPGETVQQVAATIDAPLPLDPTTKTIDFVQVVQVPGATKEELYARGKVWFASAFRSAQDVIQADDKAAGILVGRGWQPAYVPNTVGGPTPVKLWYAVKLAFKDGRYKYELTEFRYEFETFGSSPAQAEYYTSQLKNGKPTILAQSFSRALSQAAHSSGTSIEVGMSKPAIGTDF